MPRPRSISVAVLLIAALAVTPAAIPTAEASRTRTTKLAKAKSKAKVPLRQKVGQTLMVLGSWLATTKPAGTTKPAPKKSKRSIEERVLGQRVARRRKIHVPEEIPHLQIAMKKLRSTFLSIRAQERRLNGGQQGDHAEYLRFDNAKYLLDGDVLVGYQIDMINHNGITQVADTVYIRPNGTVAGTGLGTVGKLLGEGGVFASGTRAGYNRAAVQRVIDQQKRPPCDFVDRTNTFQGGL